MLCPNCRNEIPAASTVCQVCEAPTGVDSTMPGTDAPDGATGRAAGHVVDPDETRVAQLSTRSDDAVTGLAVSSDDGDITRLASTPAPKAAPAMVPACSIPAA